MVVAAVVVVVVAAAAGPLPLLEPARAPDVRERRVTTTAALILVLRPGKGQGIYRCRGGRPGAGAKGRGAGARGQVL